MVTVGTTVIRKSNADEGYATWGTVEKVLSNGKLYIAWSSSQIGGTRSTGYATQHSTLKVSAVLEVTDAVREDVLEKQRLRREAKQVENWERFPYLCLNVHTGLRYDGKEGHPRVLSLQESQVRNGFCYHCGTPAIRRCSVQLCREPSVGGRFCKDHQGEAVPVQ